MRRMAHVALAVLASLAAGCSGSVDSDAARSVRTYYKALSRGDGMTACRELVGSARREMESGRVDPSLRGASCERAAAAFRVFFRRPLEDGDIKVEQVEVNGDTATAAARVLQRRSSGGDVFRSLGRLTLRKRDGDWKIEQIAG